MFQNIFFVILTTATTKAAATMIPIHWLDYGIPYIPIRVNNQTSLRALDTASGHPLLVFDSNGTQWMQTTARIDLFPVDFSFQEDALISNFVYAIVLPINQHSALANHDEVDWFTITPRGFYPFPPENMRTNQGQFCQDPNEAVMLVAGAGMPWNAYQMSGDVVIINSISPYIKLTEQVYRMFMDEVRDIVRLSGFPLTTDRATNVTLIQYCDIPHLDEMLPEIEFALATPNPNRSGSWFINDAIPHYVRISPKDYLFMVEGDDDSSRTCDLGILPSNTGQNEIGTAIFKSHSVSFSSRRHSVIICQAPTS